MRCALARLAVPALLAALLPLPAAADGPAAPILPRPRGDSVPDHPWDILTLSLDVTVDPAAGTVAGTATYTVAPYRDGVQPFVLDGVALDIAQVTVDGAPSPWRTMPDAIIVDLLGGVNHEVRVQYSATPRTGLHFRRPGPDSPDTYPEVWSQGEGEDNRYWFPSYDHPNDRFQYTGQVRGPDGTRASTNSGVELVNYLVMLVAAPYAPFGDDINSVWAPPGTPREALVPILDPIPRMREWFGARTGVPYAWGTYRQILVQRFLYGGMENTSATIESTRLLAGPVHQPTRPGTESVVAHELAHQWYGDLLTSRDWHHLWLNEGFATFMAADWMANGRTGGDPYAWAENVRGWYAASQTPGSLTGAWFLGKDTPDNQYVYVKGASVLTMLHDRLGDAAFWRAISEYTRTRQHSLVVTYDLQRVMEDESGQNLDWFFQQWTELPYVPQLESSWTWSPPDSLDVVIRQITDTTHPTYTLPLTLEVGGDAAPRFETTWMDQDTLTVHLTTPLAPAWVAVDPNGGVLAHHTDKQTVAQWSAQAQRSPSPYARLAAVEALGGMTGGDVAAAQTTLSVLLHDGKQHAEVRRASATALGEQRAAEPLLTALSDPTALPLVRLAVATAAAKAARPADADRLADARAQEPNGDIRAALLRALAAADAARALRASRLVLRATVATPGFDDGVQEVEVRAAVDILGEHGAPGDLPLLLAAPTSHDRRAGGLNAATRIVSRMPLGGERESMRRRVARSAEALLDDLDLRGRRAAVGVLAEVGDNDTITRLERFRREEEVASLLDATGRTLTAIRARRDEVTPPTPNEVDARLKAFEERLKSMEDRERGWQAH